MSHQFFPTFVVCFALFCQTFGRIVDLTWNVDNTTLHWPDTAPFRYSKEIGNYDSGYWYAMKEFCTGEHVGTHFDAPLHFYDKGWNVAQVPTSRLIANGALLDLSKRKMLHDLSIKDLEEYVKEHGDFKTNTVLLIKFGWSRFWYSERNYYGYNDFNDMVFPGITKEAAEWLASRDGIVGVGVDTASLDPGNSTSFQAHRILLKSQIYGLENVKLFDDYLPANGFMLYAFPMKLAQGTGAPVRLIAITNP